jgi:hypothetical protein
MQTKNNERFMRLWWVVLLTGKRENYIHRNAITFSKRSQLGFSARIMPRETIFSANGPGVFPGSSEDVLFDLALLNSNFSRACLEFLTSFGSYSEGYVESLPYPVANKKQRQDVSNVQMRCVEIARLSRAAEETNREFSGCISSQTEHSLHSLFDMRGEHLERLSAILKSAEMELDVRLSVILSLSDSDRRFCESAAYRSSLERADQIEVEDASEEGSDDGGSFTSLRSITSDVLSFAVGAVVGRWDVRNKAASEIADVFEPYPACSPGMLRGPDHLPAKETPHDYALHIKWDGIIPDDADHPGNVVRQVREVLDLIWKERSEKIEKEACEILGVNELLDYFRKPGKGGFWDDHVSRYSKSRRKAPVYWLLQSSNRNYALWLYYHRLDKDLLFKALKYYVEPKIQLESTRRDDMRRQKQAAAESSKGIKKLEKDIERQEDLVSELRDFEDKLRRAATLHLEPDLNDGVVLNIAPLHELVPWKEARSYWDELLKGKYEWSSIGKQLRQEGIVK